MKRLLHTLLLLTLLQTAKAQMLYYQNTYKGGCSFDGVTYIGLSWQFPDTIHFQNSVPAGCTLKRAFLISFKESCMSNHWPTYDTPIHFKYNNHDIQFDTSNVITPASIVGISPIIGYNWMSVKDVTLLTLGTGNILITPLQSYANDCEYYYYDGFYLLLLYENNTYNAVNIAVYLNDESLSVPTMTYTLNGLNPINTSSDVGLSIESADDDYPPYLQYQLNSSMGSYNIGTLRQQSLDGNTWYKTGLGSFHYENGTLSGLVDDSPDSFIDSTDALANIKTYVANNTTTFSLVSTNPNVSTTFDNNLTTAFITAYSTPCPAVTSNADSIKVYKFCTNANTQLQATGGYANYNWFPATGLSNANIANPVVNTQNSTNYICYVKDTAGCMHTEHAQVIVHQPPAPQRTSITTAICGSTQGTLSVTPNQHNYGYTYSVDNGMPKTITTFNNLTTGQHTLTVKDTSLGCTYTTPFTIKDTNLAKASFFPEPDDGCTPLSIYCLNQSNNLGNVTNAYVWYTNGDSAATQNFSYTYADTGTYNITLLAYETYRQCSDTLTRQVYVKYCPPDSFSLTAPNVFSPNGDGINEAWLPIVHNYQYTVNTYQCTIYDRWGIKMFETDNINTGWQGHTTSGTAATIGTYFYTIHYKATSQSKGAVKEETLKGFIQLIK